MKKSKDQIIKELREDNAVLKEMVAWLAPFGDLDPVVAEEICEGVRVGNRLLATYGPMEKRSEKEEVDEQRN